MSRTTGMAVSALLASLVPVPGTHLAGQTLAGALDTLEVRVSSRVAPGLSARTRTVSVLTRAEIEALPARSVGDLLRWMNGVELQQRSGAQADLSLRGAGFEQVLVLVDGVRVSDAQSGHFDLDLAVPVDRIQRIEVLRGPASALFGADAVGGVVNLVTTAAGAETARPEVTGRLEGGSFGTLRVSSTQAVPVGTARLSFGEEWAESDGDRRGTDYRNVLVHGSLDAPLGGGTLSLAAGWAGRDFGASDFYAPIPSYEETRTTRVAGAWSSGDLGGLRMEARLSVRDHDDRFVFYRDDPDAGQNVHDGRQLGGELTLRRARDDGSLSVALGVEGWQDELESSNLGERSESRGAVFGEGVARLGDAGVVTLGLRADGHEEYGGVVSPSLGASWDVGSHVRLRSRLARSFRPPTWTERHYVDPFHQASADLDPETAWAWEAGVVVAPSGGWSLRLTGFVRRTEDLVDWARPEATSDDVKWVTRNVREADYAGLEVDAAGTGPLGIRWDAGLSLLDLDTSAEPGFVSKRALRPETRRVTVAVSRGFGGAVALALRGLHARRLDHAAHHQVDLRLRTALPRGVLYLDVVNLTDQDYHDASGRAVPGLGAYLGYRIGG